MDNSTLRSLIEEFASLQAAHRALAHSVHPSALAPVKDQSRALLIQLQALSSDQKTQTGSGPSHEIVEQIRAGLKEQAERTLTVLEGIELPQLRASIPVLSQQHPEEVRGLIDVLLTGDLEEDKSLRILEYLITMLSTEEKGGRRVVIREPSQATARLRAVGSERMQGNESQSAAAERFIEDAMLELLKNGELGDVRDRVRNFKQELGSNVLQPRVLAVAIAYNAAMWNRVAAEIDSSRSVEELLTEGLLAPDADAISTPSSAAGSEPEVLGSETFRRLVEALATRVAGEESNDKLACQAAANLALDSIRGEDADLFEGDHSDEAIWLMRVAVTVGLVLKHRSDVEDVLAAMGIDIDDLARHGVDQLIAHMTETARKRFAASNYSEAFRLSDVKTHCLVPHSAARLGAGSLARPALESVEPRRRASDPQPESTGLLAQLRRGLPSPPVFLIGVVILSIFLMPPLRSRDDEESALDLLEAISPFLVHGQHSPDANPPRFLGRLGRAWSYLGTPERAEVTNEIGQHFANLGTPRVTLTDQRNQVVAQYKNGKILTLVPRPSAQVEEE